MNNLTDTKLSFDLRTTFPHRVAIIGAARSGIAAAGYFRSKDVPLFISDTCSAEKLDAILAANGLSDVAREAGGHTARVLESDLIVLSPGVRSDLPVILEARARAIPVWSEMELGFAASDATFLAITGSTGKSTTVSMLGEALVARDQSFQVRKAARRALVQAELTRPNGIDVVAPGKVGLHLAVAAGLGQHPRWQRRNRRGGSALR